MGENKKPKKKLKIALCNNLCTNNNSNSSLLLSSLYFVQPPNSKFVRYK